MRTERGEVSVGQTKGWGPALEQREKQRGDGVRESMQGQLGGPQAQWPGLDSCRPCSGGRGAERAVTGRGSSGQLRTGTAQLVSIGYIMGESKLWRLGRDVIPRPYLHFSLQQFDGQLPDVQRYGVVYSDGLSGEGLPSQIGLEWLRRQTAPCIPG